ncbi:MAG TPA: bacteriohemerythrin [Pseudobdellovibrionaceae bacterium]|nr:bacteriohemerythrin [Pseudobdellovibrionaceae bacterium]
MAELFTWDPGKFGVGVATMDNEHKELIKLMNNLYTLHLDKKPVAEIEKALTALGNYTVKHFKDEEDYFSKLPEYNQTVKTHMIIHQDLLKKFTTHAENFKKTQKLEEAFFQFLKMWLAAHIVGVDKKYGAVSKAA